MIKVLGIPQAIAQFALVGVRGQVAAQVGRKALAEEVAAFAREHVPVLTGETRDSITVNDEGVTSGGASLYLEFGTSFMSAQPFMRPAADSATGAGAEAAMVGVMHGLA